MPTRFVPPQALVLALTPLLDDAVVRALLELRGRGFDLAVVELPPLSYVPLDDEGVRRLVSLERDLLRSRLRARGIAVVEWDEAAVAGGHSSRDGGVPTKSTRRPRLATAIAALVAAIASAAYPVVTGSLVNGLVPLACLIGIGALLAGLLSLWEDGLALGPAAIALGYALSLAPGDTALDRGAPVVAVGLLAAVELGSWSLELRDGPEERLRAHLWRVLVLLVAAFAASLLVLSVGGLRADAGIALFAIGAAAALGLLALIARPGELLRRRRST